MSQLVVLLDSGPLGMVSNPKETGSMIACTRWFAAHLRAGTHFVLPEIADYEVRRELLRARKFVGLRRLNEVANRMDYLPLSTTMMRKAAELWAQVRQAGLATADRHALDGDVILAAQALSISAENTIIATTNTKHLSRFAKAAHWNDIKL